MINGIVWRLRAGAPWADMTARCGPHGTYVNRFSPVHGRYCPQSSRRGGALGTYSSRRINVYEGDYQIIASSFFRVHQHGANSPKRGGRSDCRARARRVAHKNPYPHAIAGSPVTYLLQNDMKFQTSLTEVAVNGVSTVPNLSAFAAPFAFGIARCIAGAVGI